MNSNNLTRILRVFDKSLVVIAMIGFIVMLMAVGCQVLFRYVLRIAVPWTEELARALFVLSSFLGIAIAIREKEHMVVDVYFKKLSSRSQALGHIVFSAAILMLLFFLAKGAVFLMQTGWGVHKIALGVPVAYLYMGEFITILFMMFYVIIELLENIQSFRLARKEEVKRRIP